MHRHKNYERDQMQQLHGYNKKIYGGDYSPLKYNSPNDIIQFVLLNDHHQSIQSINLKSIHQSVKSS